MRIVVALGGNALLRRGEKPDASTQIHNVEIAAHELAKLAEKHELVLTHGNGPQVGVLALQSANDERLSEPYPFDTLGAQTQGMIGYWLLQAMQNALPGRHVAAMVNQTLVMAGDPAFSNPTKFVGEVYTKEEAEKLAEERGWVVKPDGEHYRRVVGSPMPQRVIETRLVRTLLDAGAIVVCSGGGGVPVVRSEEGKLKGIEAVIDKDLTASVMAEALEAGARAYLLKTVHGAEISDVVRAVASGRVLLDERTVTRRRADHDDPTADLTNAERKVLDLIGDGLSNREIGERLGVAEKTVKNHITSLLAKMGLQRRTQVAAWVAGQRASGWRNS